MSYISLITKRIISSILIITILLSVYPVLSVSAASPNLSPIEKAAFQLSAMTPEEKVGQLFLITFNGPDTSPAAPIIELITNYHIGGVIFRSSSTISDLISALFS